MAGFRAFLQLNRCVRRGERAIRILAPVAVNDRDQQGEETGERRVVFRTVPVFDLSMTESLTGRKPVPLTGPAQPIERESRADLMPRLLQLAREVGYRAEIRRLPGPVQAHGATRSASRS